MKSSWNLGKELCEKYQKILNYDRNEIDNPDKYNPLRLMYIDRIRTVISIIRKNFTASKEIKIGDFGCAQGNTSLTLAELGYKVYATDINPVFIEYSKMKYEKGEIEWIVGNIDDLGLPANFLDAAITGEVIEHCAYPEEIVEKIISFVRPGGLLIFTTPNGSRIRTNLPTFEQVLEKGKRKVFEQRQFGPDGEHHLFLFKLEEIKYIIKDVSIIEEGYCGSTILANKYSHPFLKLFPITLVEWAISILSRIPIVNRKTFNNLYVVLKKGEF